MALEVKDKGNRLIINGTTSTSERVKSGPIVITTILWKGPTTVNHIAQFVDADDDIELFLQCITENQPLSDDFPMGHNTLGDLYCNDLDSGTIIIYYKSHY